jgi:hypothetical protein
VATVEAERVFQLVEALTRRFVAAVDNPPVGLEQNGGTEVAFGIPSVARAARGAAEAENAFVKPVELCAVLR